MNENVFGIRVNVETREEKLATLGEPGLPVICQVVRCVDLPAAAIPEPFRSRNRRTPCDNCREICWYDPVHAIPGLRILCSHCAPKAAEYHATVEQLTEIFKHRS